MFNKKHKNKHPKHQFVHISPPSLLSKRVEQKVNHMKNIGTLMQMQMMQMEMIMHVRVNGWPLRTEQVNGRAEAL